MIHYRDILGKITLPENMDWDTEQIEEYIIDRVLENTEIEIPHKNLETEISRLSAMCSRQMQYDMILSGDFNGFRPDYLAACRQKVQLMAERQLKTERLLYQLHVLW